MGCKLCCRKYIILSLPRILFVIRRIRLESCYTLDDDNDNDNDNDNGNFLFNIIIDYRN